MRSTSSAALLSLLLIAITQTAAGAVQTPSNEELYQMYLMQQEQLTQLERLLQHQDQKVSTLATRAETAESQLVIVRDQFLEAQQELALARQVTATLETTLAAPLVESAPVRQEAEFKSSIRALYMQPVSDSFDFLQGLPSQGPNDILSVVHEFEPGVEASFSVASPNNRWTFDATGRWLNNSHTESAVANGNSVFAAGFTETNFTLQASRGELVTASSRVSLYSADLDATYQYGDDFDLGVIAGVRFAYLDRELNITGTGTGDTSLNQASFTGAGPKIGVSGYIPLSNGFGLRGMGTGSMLLGASKVASQNDADGNGTFNRFKRLSSAFVPVFDTQWGLTWESNISRSSKIGENLGFETQN